MPTAGPLFPSVGADVTGSGGANAWTNPGNITVQDSVRANVFLPSSGDSSHYLRGTGFGFAIPGGATINGVLLEVAVIGEFGGVNTDTAVQLVKAGVVSGSNRANGVGIPNSGVWTMSYGGAADLWGLTLSDTDVNAANFGAVYAVGTSFGDSVYVDAMRITVTYTPGGTGARNPRMIL